MMKHLSLIRTIFFTAFLLVAQSSFAQERPFKQGDYRSAADGSWANPAVWEQYHNTFGWRNCLTANIGPPSKLSVVTIKSGTTIFIDDGSNIPAYLAAMPVGGEGRSCPYPYEVNKLVIESGGKIISTVDHDNPAGSNQITHPFSGVMTTNSYDQGGYTLKVFGDSILNNGELGGDGVDGIILEMPAPTTQNMVLTPSFGFRLTGTGTTKISKLRMVGGSWASPPYYAPGPDVVVNIEQNMILGGSGSTFTAVYKPTVTDYYTLRIHPGKTVTLTNPLAVIHDQAVTAGSAAGGGIYVYKIDGTLDASACTGVMTFTKLATPSSLIVVDVTPPGKLIVQLPLTKSSVGNSSGDVLFLPANGSGVVVLPLDILTFNARLNEGAKNVVALSWTTTNERNTKAFEVERSNDGKEFNEIGTVSAINSAGTHSYSFIDNEPFIGTSYYRLKQTDIDGKHKFSAIQSINARSKIGIVAFPNPAKDRLTVVFGELPTTARIDILAADGRLMRRVNAAQGATQTTLDVSGLQRGYYMIRVQDGSDKTILKFYKN